MNIDELTATWRTQDKTSLSSLNLELLQQVIQTDLRRKQRREQWEIYGTSAFLLGILLFFFAAIYFDNDPRTVWDYVAAIVATGAVLAWAGAFWMKRRLQKQREHDFGNSLQDEVKRNLSLVDDQLSRTGQWHAVSLAAAPLALAGSLVYWLTVQINNEPFGWFDAGIVVFVIVAAAQGAMQSSRKVTKDLLPYKRRLTELLAILNAPD